MSAIRPRNLEQEFPDLRQAIADLYRAGISIIPLGGGNDGKSPLVAFKGRKPLPERVTLDRMRVTKSSMYGIRLSGLVVVDCDSDNIETLEYVESRYGTTSFRIKTPRGWHYYYKAETPIVPYKIREGNVSIDLKSGANQYVVGPFSIRPDGGSYRLFECGIDNIGKIPEFRDRQSYHVPLVTSKIPVGRRWNDFIWKKAAEFAPCVDTENSLFEELRSAVEYYCEEPESVHETEIRKAGKWAWGKRLENNLWNNGNNAVITRKSELEALAKVHNGSDGLMLLQYLKCYHSERSRAGKPFAISRLAMVKADTIVGWSESRYRRATKALVEAEVLRCVKKGGMNRGVSLYQFSTPLMI